ncbi:hypothetical protein M0R45_009667 [Rubus argutus]|uniref:Uncharacterized protein n=1 Tax=Rubus argutus TaxID=59490 RepID=A0AAW1Y857_RUBAR
MQENKSAEIEKRTPCPVQLDAAICLAVGIFSARCLYRRKPAREPPSPCHPHPVAGVLPAISRRTTPLALSHSKPLQERKQRKH